MRRVHKHIATPFFNWFNYVAHGKYLVWVEERPSKNQKEKDYACEWMSDWLAGSIMDLCNWKRQFLFIYIFLILFFFSICFHKIKMYDTQHLLRNIKSKNLNFLGPLLGDWIWRTSLHKWFDHRVTAANVQFTWQPPDFILINLRVFNNSSNNDDSKETIKKRKTNEKKEKQKPE